MPLPGFVHMRPLRMNIQAKRMAVALGRLKPGPEADLIKDYQRRFNGAAPGLGFGKFEIRELELKKRISDQI